MYGRTQDGLSINNIASKQGQNLHHNDDDDDVSALRAAVNGERVKG